MDEILNLIESFSEGFPSYSYLVHSEINRYNQPNYFKNCEVQSFVINIINLLGALYLIFKLFRILISKLVPLTPETVRTLNMFIRLHVILLRAI